MHMNDWQLGLTLLQCRFQGSGSFAGKRPEAEVSMEEGRRSALFMRHRVSLARFARKLVKDPEDARDLMQDLVILIIAHPTGPIDETCFHAWCRGLMRNVAAHHWRAKARRTERTSSVGLEICEFPEETS